MTSMIRREDNQVRHLKSLLSLYRPAVAHTCDGRPEQDEVERVVQRLSLQVPEELTNRRSEKRVGDWWFVNQPRALDPPPLAAMPLLQVH